jgi:hypothetical protein
MNFARRNVEADAAEGGNPSETLPEVAVTQAPAPRPASALRALARPKDPLGSPSA